MNMEIVALQALVSDSIKKGKLVELLSPAISDGYEAISELHVANGQFAHVKLRSPAWLTYLIPAHSIVGVRLRDQDDLDEDL